MINRNRRFFVIVMSGVLLSGFVFGGYLGKTRGVPFMKRTAEYSIGIYTGKSPFELESPEGIENPVLTAADVTDVRADFVADPFMVNEKGKWYMFFEVLNSDSGHGDVGLAVSGDGKKWDYERIVLDEPFHLSYPNVFKVENEYYMIPETKVAYTIRLYKATDFPYEWTVVEDLIQGNYLDPSIFHHNNKWWIFAAERNDVLHLFYSDQLVGPWEEHCQNPLIVEDGNIARPGGRVIKYNGSFYRFTQDCDPDYGNQVRAFKITELTPDAYAEVGISQNPILKASGQGWNAEKMHHVDLHQIDEQTWMACVDGYGKKTIYGLKY